jgi:hypothetical protein
MQRKGRFSHILMANETGGKDMKEEEDRLTASQELQLIGHVLSLFAQFFN